GGARPLSDAAADGVRRGGGHVCFVGSRAAARSARHHRESDAARVLHHADHLQDRRDRVAPGPRAAPAQSDDALRRLVSGSAVLGAAARNVGLAAHDRVRARVDAVGNDGLRTAARHAGGGDLSYAIAVENVSKSYRLWGRGSQFATLKSALLKRDLKLTPEASVAA